MTPQEILTEIYKLPPVERKEILNSLTEDCDEPENDDLRLQKALFDAGLLHEIKPPRKSGMGDFKAIKIKGKPLSETIIEERR